MHSTVTIVNHEGVVYNLSDLYSSTSLRTSFGPFGEKNAAQAFPDKQLASAIQPSKIDNHCVAWPRLG